MSVFEIVGLNGITSVFSNIWLIILYNIITPIIIFSLAGALIFVQYLIFVLYRYLAIQTYKSIIFLYNYISGIKKVKQFVSDFKGASSNYADK